ncbi:hypothetical protein AMJ44_00860 [candidate division WOR-1 bacterium DG_54_3]|uniref:Uncharacterized protein n=1 Tax=candidate division WOR-1 bacterium DG_54_3 TaxID=1703775 RepID=A0A0S7Y5L5_UNCSA|nr:MAG: hypothetical protein AMJ44_00860 [candidate division WOR-1 bacterium DG_54_3]
MCEERSLCRLQKASKTSAHEVRMERKRVINPHLYLHKGKMPVFIKSITPLGLCLSIIPLF